MSNIYVTFQHLLNEAGVKPPLTVDGAWGAQSKHALMSFQQHHGLAADGMPGPRSLHALKRVIQHRRIAMHGYGYGFGCGADEPPAASASAGPVSLVAPPPAPDVTAPPLSGVHPGPAPGVPGLHHGLQHGMVCMPTLFFPFAGS
jgi:peptidoglycan hydrolase-like protein with peptidoglycan-binding domain